MKSAFTLFLISLGIFVSGTAMASQTLCGWVSNPTPGNLTLQDRSQTWVIESQGGLTVKGAEKVWDSKTTDAEFVDTTGPMRTGYGVWCGCVDADVNRAKNEITKVHSAKQNLLKTCLEDYNLPVFDFPRE